MILPGVTPNGCGLLVWTWACKCAGSCKPQGRSSRPAHAASCQSLWLLPFQAHPSASGCQMVHACYAHCSCLHPGVVGFAKDFATTASFRDADTDEIFDLMRAGAGAETPQFQFI